MEVRQFSHPLGPATRFIFSHLPEVTRALLQERPRRIVRPESSRRFFRLSQMSLCMAWERIPIPEGYSIVDINEGRVTSRDTQTGRIIWQNTAHEYLEKVESDGRRKIVCLTAAQFKVENFDEYGLLPSPKDRGKTMEQLLAMAIKAGRPEIYTILSDDVAVLEGYTDEISTIFGLDYYRVVNPHV